MYCMGLNHRTAPVAVRECFSVPKSRLVAVDAALATLPGVRECVLLSTCNRTELYYWSDAPETAAHSIRSHFLQNAPMSAELSTCFYHYEAEDALAHLARVAAGLDSMVIGETEIFGQLKDAYRAAQEAGATAAFANRTLQHIFTIGKKVRSSTRITCGPTSVGAAAVQLARQILGDLENRRVLIVGAGDVARSTAQSLTLRGASGIFVANRSYDRAVELAGQVGGQVIRFSEWVPYLEQIDIVIVSTASPAYVVSPRVLAANRQARKGRKLFLIDLSVPRNVDPACAEVPGVHVYDIDAMESMADETRRARSAEIASGETMIREWVKESAPVLFHPGHREPRSVVNG